nr:hypothetical protein [Tanacetum cinerariifolium]
IRFTNYKVGIRRVVPRNYNPKGKRFLIASRFPPPPLASTMTDNHTMAEMLCAPTEGCAEAIIVPPILAEQFELKHSLINMMTSKQFFGLEKDNPHDHIRAACRWLKKEPPRSITTWDDLVLKFINEFFPPSRTTNLHQDYLNAAAGGNLLEKSPQDALTIIENKSKVRNSRKEDECVEETYTDPDLVEYTIKVPPPPPVQIPKPPIQRNFVLHTIDSLPPHILDPRVPLILGRQFLRTARARIDVHDKIQKLEDKVDQLEEENKALKEKSFKTTQVDTAAPVENMEKSFKQGMMIADMDEDDIDEEKHVEVEEVLEVVKATKLMTEVVTTAQPTTTTVAQVPKPSAPKRKRGVVIQDPEETAALVIVHSEVQSKRIDEEAKEMKTHLQIVANDDDDMYTEATPLASKVPVVDYQIHHENNKPYYKIIKVNETHKLFLSFITLLKNFDRDDLKTLWKLVKERFESTEPKNFLDDFLLNILRIMFEKSNVEANVWKEQKGIYGLTKKYPLTHFTLEQMLNNLRLEVKEESEMSIELLSIAVQSSWQWLYFSSGSGNFLHWQWKLFCQ